MYWIRVVVASGQRSVSRPLRSHHGVRLNGQLAENSGRTVRKETLGPSDGRSSVHGVGSDVGCPQLGRGRKQKILSRCNYMISFCVVRRGFPPWKSIWVARFYGLVIFPCTFAEFSFSLMTPCLQLVWFILLDGDFKSLNCNDWSFSDLLVRQYAFFYKSTFFHVTHYSCGSFVYFRSVFSQETRKWFII
jgi:hypothetical protein